MVLLKKCKGVCRGGGSSTENQVEFTPRGPGCGLADTLLSCSFPRWGSPSNLADLGFTETVRGVRQKDGLWETKLATDEWGTMHSSTAAPLARCWQKQKRSQEPWKCHPSICLNTVWGPVTCAQKRGIPQTWVTHRPRWGKESGQKDHACARSTQASVSFLALAETPQGPFP